MRGLTWILTRIDMVTAPRFAQSRCNSISFRINTCETPLVTVHSKALKQTAKRFRIRTYEKTGLGASLLRSPQVTNRESIACPDSVGVTALAPTDNSRTPTGSHPVTRTEH
jgi:hypothetical protein